MIKAKKFTKILINKLLYELKRKGYEMTNVYVTPKQVKDIESWDSHSIDMSKVGTGTHIYNIELIETFFDPETEDFMSGYVVGTSEVDGEIKKSVVGFIGE